MKEELYTIQLTRRELGLIKHYSRLLFANIDDDVSLDGGSCTGSHPIEKDWYGKDAITNLYKKSKTIVGMTFDFTPLPLVIAISGHSDPLPEAMKKAI